MAEETQGTAGAASGAEQSNTSSSGQATSESGSSSAPSGQAPQIVDITDPARYRYEGRPLKEWQSGYMRQQDYTAKTQAYAQERRYVENLHIDLERVKANPQLAEQFRQIYPEKYHAYLRLIESGTPRPTANPQTPQQQYAQLDPRFVAEFNQMKESQRQREVQAISAELDNVYQKYQQKYPFADDEAVTARAQALFQKLKEQDPMNPNVRISDKQWDALWKSQNERAQKLAEDRYKTQVKAQLEASRKGSSAGGGGGVPGQAPREFKNLKEATQAAMRDIESGAI